MCQHYRERLRKNSMQQQIIAVKNGLTLSNDSASF
jgi:hypothetical protein